MSAIDRFDCNNVKKIMKTLNRLLGKNESSKKANHTLQKPIDKAVDIRVQGERRLYL